MYMTKLKNIIIDMVRMILLFLVLFLPLIFIIMSTELSVKIHSLIGIFLFLSTIIIIYYFLGKYGSIYKLVFVSLVRNMQFLEEHDVYMVLLAGSAMYLITIYSLLTDLVTSPSPLAKIILSIVIVLLLVYVLPNRKYNNALELIEKIWGFLNEWNIFNFSFPHDTHYFLLHVSFPEARLRGMTVLSNSCFI